MIDEPTLKAALEKRGIKEPKLSMMVEMLRDETNPQSQKMLENLRLVGVAMETMGKAPRAAQEAVGPLFAQSLIQANTPQGGLDDDDIAIAQFRKMAIKMKMIDKLAGNDNAEVRDLAKKVQELTDMQKKQVKDEAIERIEKKMEKMEESIRGGGGVATTPEEMNKQLAAANQWRQLQGLSPFTTYQEYLRVVMGGGDGNGHGDVERAAEVLKRSGYSVKGPMTPEERKQWMDRKLKMAEDRIREELEIKREQNKMIVQILTEIPTAIMNTIASVKGTKGAKEAADAVGEMANSFKTQYDQAEGEDVEEDDPVQSEPDVDLDSDEDEGPQATTSSEDEENEQR